ncbi:probable E3 ubiquitin-protein ligase HIP1 isoform X2 [Brachypodium distachyon]|nr:probable E3 ubiquitin-protein ligase HIP1 isoform X2 [Brachypodium distachyon]XP_014751491.1 probable E3 ubiquitin-protein ligase HIP1 isoform X2 [Brachypodium distachyon]XP_014751493.1 probable E3 ubiquitin-protein ligase HIP1 isoform X2 [Brachypodium distachyon]|eukprot:XP_010239610.1 probable E3 ubiquitin-protein ligase HIP1 isoform X2 [Brachypodium distachyon]
MLSSSETCHIGSSSSNQAIDQQSLLPSNPAVDDQSHTLESENYPHYLLNSREVGMPSGSMIGQQNTSLSLWDSAGSSSMGCLADHDTLLQAKREHFAPSLSIGRPLTTEGRRRESSSSLPSHNLNIDLNLNQADQFDAVNVDMVQGNGQSGMNAFTLNRGLSATEHAVRHEISSDATGGSSHTVNLFNGTSGQETGVDAHRSSSKRKNIAGSIAESSASGSSRNHRQNNNMLQPSETTSFNMPSTDYGFSYLPTEQLNRNADTAANGVFSDPYAPSDHPHENERFLRNTRMRISTSEYDESLPNLLPEGSFRCSAYQPTQQQSSFIPVQPRAIGSSASSHDRPHVPAVAQFSQSLHRPSSNGNFGSRIGSSSSSADTINLRSASQDPSGSLAISNFNDPFLFGPSFFSTDDSTSLLSAPGSRNNQPNPSSSSTLRAAVNVGSQQVPGLNVSQPSSATRGSADIARRTLLAASVSHSRNSRNALQHHGHSSSSHEIRSHQPGPSSRANLQHYSRAVPPTIDRQNPSYMDLQSFMQSIATAREGRTVSELRNVVEQIRQGRSTARLEDLLADRSLIRRANLIDRHREMRLDVDNMSYEELLALGDRIGHVSTGLSEEKIMSGLKQWKYRDIPFEEPPTGVEPCCICQEEYTNGEDMGRLDCGHDFHTTCIKQWLVIKNICPICKKAALDT